MEKRAIDILKNNVKYKVMCDIMYFCNKGKILTGKQIKDNIPFDVSPNQPMSNFFKELK